MTRLSNGRFAFVIAIALLPLLIFKYTGFIVENAAWLTGRPGHTNVNWPLPLGISFITFTVISYLVDVRNGIVSPEKSFWRFFLYLSFFPHLIAGPIMRARELLPQLKHLTFKPKLLKLGVLLFAVGMIKKVVIADQVALWVDHYYEGVTRDLPHALLAFYGFAVQIYCDFSGYVDMALGLAFILGVRLPLNFNRPYSAVSIREFWRRWHMTLSRWLRDYLYIPLGGSARGAGRTAWALSVTMLLGGLWHGASWTFVLWGALHAFYMICERLVSGPARSKYFPELLARIWTFHLVCFAWIFFRAGNWGHLAELFEGFATAGSWRFLASEALFPVILITVTLAFHHYDRVSFIAWIIKKIPAAYTYAISLALIVLCKIVSLGNPSAFIYFDF